MASLPLRQAIYADWPIRLPDLRYVPVENKDLPRNPPLVLPDLWGTIGFDVTSRNQTTMGRSPWVEERGIATFVVVARSGHGDIPGVTKATALMRAWDGWRKQQGSAGCWFQNVGAPSKIELEAEGEWFLYGVRCDYRVQEQIALA